MRHNPIIKVLLYLIADFWISFSLLPLFPERSSCFNCLELWFSSSDMGDMGLLLVNLSGVETIASSGISLNYRWSSHLPACWYNLLTFWRHMFKKISLLLNYWSIPIVFMWSLRICDCNMPLSTTHCCSNVSIERTQPTVLIIILYLTNLAAWEDLPSIWKHIYS